MDYTWLKYILTAIELIALIVIINEFGLKRKIWQKTESKEMIDREKQLDILFNKHESRIASLEKDFMDNKRNDLINSNAINDHGIRLVRLETNYENIEKHIMSVKDLIGELAKDFKAHLNKEQK